jgi:hypothetical protein
MLPGPLAAALELDRAAKGARARAASHAARATLTLQTLPLSARSGSRTLAARDGDRAARGGGTVASGVRAVLGSNAKLYSGLSDYSPGGSAMLAGGEGLNEFVLAVVIIPASASRHTAALSRYSKTRARSARREPCC